MARARKFKQTVKAVTQPAKVVGKPAKAAKAAAKGGSAKTSKQANAASNAQRGKNGRATKGSKGSNGTKGAKAEKQGPTGQLITVRHMARRDINRVWEFLKISFRDVNLETVEFQRPRSKHRFEEIYEEEGTDQLVFEIEGEIVAYAECSYEVVGSDNWINPRYFEKREMRPLFVDELAVHPEYNGRGVGTFVLEQLHHIARVHGLNALVLEVAENNENALNWYKKRAFKKLDAAIFMACAVEIEPELLPPRELPPAKDAAPDGDEDGEGSGDRKRGDARGGDEEDAEDDGD